MTTYTITIDEKTKSGKSLIAYLRSLGIVQEPDDTTLKAVKELKEDSGELHILNLVRTGTHSDLFKK